jgi:hypothetical protein
MLKHGGGVAYAACQHCKCDYCVVFPVHCWTTFLAYIRSQVSCIDTSPSRCPCLYVTASFNDRFTLPLLMELYARRSTGSGGEYRLKNGGPIRSKFLCVK